MSQILHETEQEAIEETPDMFHYTDPIDTHKGWCGTPFYDKPDNTCPFRSAAMTCRRCGRLGCLWFICQGGVL